MPWALLYLAIAVASSACASMTRPDRNYWPMQRVIWSALGFVYGGAAVNALVGSTGHPVTRAVFSGGMLLALIYSVAFIRKRNRTPRFLGLNLGGDIIVTPVEDLEHAAMLVESWAAHGAMPEARATQMEAALAEGRARRAWSQGIAREARDRRAQRGGIPDDD